MARSSWVWRNGQVVPKHVAVRQGRDSISHARSELPAPSIRSDYIGNDFWSHVDGRTRITSKSQWEKHVRAAGCEILGNDTPDIKPRVVADETDVQRDVALAFEMHEQGYEAPPLERTNEFGEAHELVGKDYVHGDKPALDNGGVE